VKRALDLVGATAILVLASPVMAVAALVIRLESRGHPIYRQRRVGKDGHPFEIYKFRTMVDGAEHIGAGMAVSERPAHHALGHGCAAIADEPQPGQRRAREMAPWARARRSRSGRPIHAAPAPALGVKPITGWAQVNRRTACPGTSASSSTSGRRPPHAAARRASCSSKLVFEATASQRRHRG
jgi:lipopolysaccharide/colanic/teichoic acid biosynthesis glycosyltransferase